MVKFPSENFGVVQKQIDVARVAIAKFPLASHRICFLRVATVAYSQFSLMTPKKKSKKFTWRHHQFSLGHLQFFCSQNFQFSQNGKLFPEFSLATFQFFCWRHPNFCFVFKFSLATFSSPGFIIPICKFNHHCRLPNFCWRHTKFFGGCTKKCTKSLRKIEKVF